MRFITFVTWAVVVFAVMLCTACGGGGGGGGGNDGGNSSIAEPAELKDAAASVENAFLSGDPDTVLTTMSDEAQYFYGGAIDDFQPFMADYGKVFKNRKPGLITDTYAEYDVTLDGDTFTVTFARKEDGSWKLMRF